MYKANVIIFLKKKEKSHIRRQNTLTVNTITMRKINYNKVINMNLIAADLG